MAKTPKSQDTSSDTSNLTPPVSDTADAASTEASAVPATSAAPGAEAEGVDAAPSSEAPEVDAPEVDAQAASSGAESPEAAQTDAPTSDGESSEDGEEQEPPRTTTFEEMGLPPAMLRSLEKMGWDKPTPVQVKAFGPVTSGKDVLVQSQTGSGKTGAFCLPWLAARFQEGDAAQTGVQLLVLTPTRELAKQVCDQLIQLSDETPLTPLAVYGGTAIGPQFDALKAGVHAVVGTPGRILDHIRRRTLDLSKVNSVVLDEADEMLSMGFLEDIHYILDVCQKDRQTTLFSATVPSDIERIARRYMKKPLSLKLSGDEIAAAQIEHTYYSVPGTMRTRDLLGMVALEEPGSTLVFCNTREETNLVANVLRKEGFSAEAISSDLSQAAREHVLGAMRKGRLRFLVATDVASRGIDISHISHVVNYSFPQNAESYVHRTGRTGRAGRAGKAISLIGPHDMGNFYHLKLAYPSIKFDEAKLPPPDEVDAARQEHKLDQISKRFPELVSPEWTLLARTLSKDPRGEQVIAYLLSEAMSNPAPTVARDLPDEEEDSRERGYGDRRDGRREGGRGRGRFEGRGRRDRDHDRDRDRDRGRGRDRDRRGDDDHDARGEDSRDRSRRRSRRRDRDEHDATPTEDAQAGVEVAELAPAAATGEETSEARTPGADTEQPNESGGVAAESSTEDGDERQGRRRRRRRRRRDPDGDAPDGEAREGAGADHGAEGEGEPGQQVAGDAAGATQDAEPRSGRRRRRRGRRGGSRDATSDASSDAENAASADADADAPPAGPVGPAPTPLNASESSEVGSGQIEDPADAPQAAEGTETETETGEPVAVSEAAQAGAPSELTEIETLHDGASARGRRRRRRRRRRGPKGHDGADKAADSAEEGADASASTSAGEAPSEGADEGKGRKRRRRRRSGSRGGQGGRQEGEARKPEPSKAHVSQDQIIIDIDESELEVVRGEFGEIDELDDLTLKGRRRGVIDALQDEVELEDMSDADGPPPESDEGDGSDEGDESEGSDEGAAEGDGAEDSDAPLSEKDEKKKKRRRRRRKKKAEPVAPPELAAPPHKDFWEVWAAKFTYKEFEDDTFRGGTEAIVDEPDPPPAPRASRSRRSRRSDHEDAAPEVDSAPLAPAEDGPLVTVSLNVGRSHKKKAAHIRELLATEFGLEGRTVRNLTVKETLTEFRVGKEAYDQLSRGLLGYVFDDIELELTVIEGPASDAEDAEGTATTPSDPASEADSAPAPAEAAPADAEAAAASHADDEPSAAPPPAAETDDPPPQAEL